MHKLKEVISEQEIQERVKELGKEISQVYQNEPLVVICTLKGAFLFFSDLVRQISCPHEVDFVRVASYGNSGSSSQTIAFTKDIELNVEGKHVLIVEDIIDTGLTMEFLLHQLGARKAKSIKVATLISKKARREKSIPIDFVGFYINDGFIVGYGLDYAEKYRSLPSINEVEI